MIHVRVIALWLEENQSGRCRKRKDACYKQMRLVLFNLFFKINANFAANPPIPSALIAAVQQMRSGACCGSGLCQLKTASHLHSLSCSDQSIAARGFLDCLFCVLRAKFVHIFSDFTNNCDYRFIQYWLRVFDCFSVNKNCRKCRVICLQSRMPTQLKCKLILTK
jgi:hypothetical protein